MKRKGLTLTLIVRALPANYDIGYGNISVMKKVHRGDGTTVPFTSRQALRYSLVQWLIAHNLWKETPVNIDQQVVQYTPDELEKFFYEEADLFGYMVTVKGKNALTRPAVARLTPMIGLDRYFGDQELLTNKGMADRYRRQQQIREEGDNMKGMNMASIETAYNFYKYTLAVDLDRVGEDTNFDHHLSSNERIRRVHQLLEAVKFLYRDIRGRREDLQPLFVVGGVYPIKSNFFHNAMDIQWVDGSPHLLVDALQAALQRQLPGQGTSMVKDQTHIGVLPGIFGNEDAIRSIHSSVESPDEAIQRIQEQVKEAYQDS